MGVCQSVEEKAAKEKNEEIEMEMERAWKKGAKVIKLFLLGPGESGKSTILKQMRIIHDNGFSEEELTQQKAVVYNNIVTGMLAMLQAMKNLGVHFQHPKRQEDAKMVSEIVDLGEESEPIRSNLAAALKRLWADNGVQEIYKRRNEYQLDVSAKYFLDSLDRITKYNYHPTQEDVLHTRVKTTGIIKMIFKIKNIEFQMIDAGGQRSERRKWIHFFEDVKAVIFIAAISEFDQVLHEDETMNRMEETLGLFDEICNNKWLDKSSMILFLNKIDLFKEKLEQVSIKVFFKDYKGPQNYDSSVAFVQQKFLELNKNPKKTIYTHRTCATDTEQVQFVLETCIDLIFDQNLGGFGLK